MKEGPVFIHCYAGIERSPLICMAWLVKYKMLSPSEALQYVMEVTKVIIHSLGNSRYLIHLIIKFH